METSKPLVSKAYAKSGRVTYGAEYEVPATTDDEDRAAFAAVRAVKDRFRAEQDAGGIRKGAYLSSVTRPWFAAGDVDCVAAITALGELTADERAILGEPCAITAETVVSTRSWRKDAEAMDQVRREAKMSDAQLDALYENDGADVGRAVRALHDGGLSNAAAERHAGNL